MNKNDANDVKKNIDILKRIKELGRKFDEHEGYSHIDNEIQQELLKERKPKETEGESNAKTQKGPR